METASVTEVRSLVALMGIHRETTQFRKRSIRLHWWNRNKECCHLCAVYAIPYMHSSVWKIFSTAQLSQMYTLACSTLWRVMHQRWNRRECKRKQMHNRSGNNLKWMGPFLFLPHKRVRPPGTHFVAGQIRCNQCASPLHLVCVFPSM